ncbi:hypothetical protein M0811_10601 [Anaeramoeba ignava]|uniref:Fibronectin type-III domain-containing protein n=1 Tax=Anaeramoeba ignava TaxID=1746090 RepID=A0A9Q0LDY7_ANAIG|nr:hypothetical protein M0811_10601 [Anaeramoeba ignava]
MISIFPKSILIFLTLLFFSAKATYYEWEKQVELIPTDGNEFYYFGFSSYLAKNYCIIGAYKATINNISDQGKAYIYQNNGTNWNYLQEISPQNSNVSEFFASCVAINNDFAFVGASQATVNNNTFQGKVYVFKNNGSYWNQSQNLIASDGKSNDNFGLSIAVYNDVLIVGSPQSTVGNNSEQGKVYVFKNNGTYWNELQILIASDGNPNDNFGASVAIYNDVLIVGSPQAAVGNNSEQGKVYVFKNNGTYWNQQQILVSSDGQQDDTFGTSVGIEKNYSIIGAFGATVDENFAQGKAYIFQNNGTYWNQQQILIASDGESSDNFGVSSAISNGVVIIGAYNAAVGKYMSQGKAYIFQSDGIYWNQLQIISPNDTLYGELFGTSVSISENYIVVGAPDASLGNTLYVGKAYIFQGFPEPNQVNIENCTSLYSSFECYWDQIGDLSTISYQINYHYYEENWIDINSPSLNGSILYEIFDSLNYPNIIGNVEYSIQIRACNISTNFCGAASLPWNLTTRIDSVKDLQLNPNQYYINISWSQPDVPVINLIPKLDHYVISYFNQSQTNLINNISVSNSSTSYQLNNLESLTLYSISIWACQTENCSGNEQGEIISQTTSTVFGPVTNFTCSTSNIYNLSCSWKPPTNSQLPNYYNFTIQSSQLNDYQNYSINSTILNTTLLYSNIDYTITIKGCNNETGCGIISTIELKTTQLNASNINSWETGIEQIKLNISSVEFAKGYQITLNEGNEWKNFSQINSSGNNIYGEINNIAGNIEYNVEVRACSETSCNSILSGKPSNNITMKARLGYVEEFNCVGIIEGFECNWNELNLASGLNGYSLSYYMSKECLANDTTYFEVDDDLEGGVEYSVSIQAVTTTDCFPDEYSGPITTIKVTTQKKTVSNSSKNKGGIIAASIIVPLFVIALVIGIVFYIKKRESKRRGYKELNLKNVKEPIFDDFLDSNDATENQKLV